MSGICYTDQFIVSFSLFTGFIDNKKNIEVSPYFSFESVSVLHQQMSLLVNEGVVSSLAFRISK